MDVPVRRPFIYGAVLLAFLIWSYIPRLIFSAIIAASFDIPLYDSEVLCELTGAILFLCGLWSVRSVLGLRLYFAKPTMPSHKGVSWVIVIGLTALASLVIYTRLHGYVGADHLITGYGLILLVIENVLYAGIAEELVFRGFFLTGFLRFMPLIPSVLFTNILFTGAHYWQDGFHFQFMVLRMGFGILLSVIALASKSLLPGAIVHAVYDLSLSV